jgi:KUP system potassium uptake protein
LRRGAGPSRAVEDCQPRTTPPALFHNLRYNKVLHEHVIVLTVTTAHVPFIAADEDRLMIDDLGRGVFTVRVQCGFTEDPNVPEALALARGNGATRPRRRHMLSRPIIVTRQAGMPCGVRSCSCLMARNAVRATAYFRLPAERVAELGVQVEM